MEDFIDEGNSLVKDDKISIDESMLKEAYKEE